MGKFLKECNIEKTNRYEALAVWGELEMGKTLSLVYDKKEVNIEVRYKDKVLGILSNDDAKNLTVFLDAGWNRSGKDGFPLLEGKICKFDPKADENKRLEVAVFVQGPNDLKISKK